MSITSVTVQRKMSLTVLRLRAGTTILKGMVVLVVRMADVDEQSSTCIFPIFEFMSTVETCGSTSSGNDFRSSPPTLRCTTSDPGPGVDAEHPEEVGGCSAEFAKATSA